MAGRGIPGQQAYDQSGFYCPGGAPPVKPLVQLSPAEMGHYKNLRDHALLVKIGGKVDVHVLTQAARLQAEIETLRADEPNQPKMITNGNGALSLNPIFTYRENLERRLTDLLAKMLLIPGRRTAAKMTAAQKAQVGQMSAEESQLAIFKLTQA